MAKYVKKEEVIKLIREDKVEITPNLLTITMLAAPNGYSAEDCYKAINDTCDRHIKEIRNLPAADVVERKKGEWIPVTSRPMDEEERAEWSAKIGYDIEYEDAIIYTSKLPDDGQEVLVCNEWGHVWIDTFSNDPDYGVGFEENGDMDGIVAWMPKPKPYKPPKEET